MLECSEELLASGKEMLITAFIALTINQAKTTGARHIGRVLLGAAEHLEKANDKLRSLKPCSKNQKVATADLKESFVHCSHRLTFLNIKHKT